MTGNGNFEINERFIVRVKPQDRHCSDFKDSIVEINIPLNLLLGTGENIRVCDSASNLYP